MSRLDGWARPCGKKMFVPQLTPTSAFGLDSRFRFQLWKLRISAEAPVKMRCLWVLIKRTFTFPRSHCFLVARNVLLFQRWVNQRQICFRIKPLLHRYRIDCDHDFQRRGHIRTEDMTAARCSV